MTANDAWAPFYRWSSIFNSAKYRGGGWYRLNGVAYRGQLAMGRAAYDIAFGSVPPEAR